MEIFIFCTPSIYGRYICTCTVKREHPQPTTFSRSDTHRHMCPSPDSVPDLATEANREQYLPNTHHSATPRDRPTTNRLRLDNLPGVPPLGRSSSSTWLYLGFRVTRLRRDLFSGVRDRWPPFFDRLYMNRVVCCSGVVQSAQSGSRGLARCPPLVCPVHRLANLLFRLR